MERRRTRAEWLATVACVLALPALAQAQGEMAAATEGGDPVTMPLVDEALRIHIDRQFATTTLRQTWQNERDVRVEGRYSLRAGDHARVQGFAYWNGERKIIGEVFEQQEARAVYEEVTGFGRDPGLLEETGEGAFSFRVFPIEPGEPKRVEVTYGARLPQIGRTIELRAPVRHSQPSVVVDLAEDRPVTGVSSPTHELTVRRRDDRHLEVHVDGARGPQDELVLRYEVDVPAWQIETRVHHDAGHDPYMLLSVAVPEQDATGPAPKDVTLVIDRSGSMMGEPLEQARLAALDLIERVRDGDRLNIVAFDHEVEPLYRAPRRVDDRVRDEAAAYVRRIDSGGGTDIAGALEASLAAQNRPEQDRPQVVLFLTDGQSDAEQALRVADRQADEVRIYTLGVGHGVQRPLLSRLATSHRGTFTFIASSAAITTKMARLYDKLARPVMVGPSLEVEGARAHHRYPRTLPDLYAGDELLVATRLLPGDASKVVLRGRVDGRPVTLERRVDVPAEAHAPWVGRLWAQKRVDDLLEAIALGGETEEAVREVTELALAYRFTTPYTSFLAIPEEELTDGARARIDDMRARRRKILAANPDAAALSRSAMPPGDPVLRVHAPADARQVTAYFEFGLVADLTYDAASESWVTRFLVPNHVADGDYDVRVLIVDAAGDAQLADVPYTIESDAPDLEVETEVDGREVRVRAASDGDIRRATVAWVDDPSVRAELTRSGDTTVREGTLTLPPGRHRLRVVIADRARNEADRLVEVQVP
ncbi:MAG: VWA domain-containing protein [Myxococcota bacterium]